MIKVNAYRGCFLRFLAVFIIIETVISILMAIGTVWERSSEYILIMILNCAFDGLLILFFFLIKFCKGENYAFGQTEIRVYQKDKCTEVINLDEIESMSYLQFYLKNIFLLSAGCGDSMKYGAWKLYAKYKDGTEKEIAFIGAKDARKIKELYGDKLVLL